MTQLRKMMLEELQRRNYAQSTAKQLHPDCREFAKHFQQRPDQLGPDQIRQYQAHLFRERKLDARHRCSSTWRRCASSYVKTLKRHYLLEDLPMPKRQPPHSGDPQPGRGRTADRFGQQPVSSRHADDAVLHRHAARRDVPLKVSDIDSERMVIHIHKGKGGHDRDVPLSPRNCSRHCASTGAG